MSIIEIIKLPSLCDDRGELVSIETGKTIPFSVKRIYYLFNTKSNVARGFHAHKQLQQLAVCVKGRCRMILDNGHKREEVWLDSPNEGLVIGNSLWREIHDFSDDCVLLVMASEHYDESDYIRDYPEFVLLAKGPDDA